jgi:CelD/BcsL family acetyltransferase involved in cellulose biosynthesis
LSFAADYVDVAERLRTFREKYPEGSMQPADLAVPYRIEEVGAQTFVVYVAAAYRSDDDQRPGIGVAWEEVPGKTNFTRGSELMNAETSAWGRAIVAALAADTKRIASADEVQARAGEHADLTAPAGGAADRPAMKPALDRAKAAVKAAHIQDWVSAQNFGWPWTLATCELIEQHANEILEAPFEASA